MHKTATQDVTRRQRRRSAPVIRSGQLVTQLFRASESEGSEDQAKKRESSQRQGSFGTSLGTSSSEDKSQEVDTLMQWLTNNPKKFYGVLTSINLHEVPGVFKAVILAQLCQQYHFISAQLPNDEIEYAYVYGYLRKIILEACICSLAENDLGIRPLLALAEERFTFVFSPGEAHLKYLYEFLREKPKSLSREQWLVDRQDNPIRLMVDMRSGLTITETNLPRPNQNIPAPVKQLLYHQVLEYWPKFYTQAMAQVEDQTVHESKTVQPDQVQQRESVAETTHDTWLYRSVSDHSGSSPRGSAAKERYFRAKFN